MDKDSSRFARQREEMVRRQIEGRGITDPRVLEAVKTVPRHEFVDEALIERAYGDFPLPIGEAQTISQPYMVAEMTQALALTPEDRVLEIGTGSGYQTAVLAELVYRVYSVERIHSLYAQARRRFDRLGYPNIVTRFSDGTVGWSEEAPFDAILVAAGSPKIPEPLVNQLGPGGRMVIPVGDRFSQELTKICRDERGVRQTRMGGCRFVSLVGEHGWEPRDGKPL
jgi:protein-L-isoaspartate(D-aspartate) O-methyltransferase